MRIILIFLIFFSNLSVYAQCEKSPLKPFQDNNLWGLTDGLNHIKIKPFAKSLLDCNSYEIDHHFYENISFKTRHNYTLFQENKILHFTNEEIDSIVLNHHDAYLLKNNKKGLVRRGVAIMKIMYDDIKPSLNESYIVSLNGKSGVINHLGKIVVPVEYEEIYPDFDYEYGKEKFNWRALKAGKQTIFRDTDYYLSKGKTSKTVKTGLKN